MAIHKLLQKTIIISIIFLACVGIIGTFFELDKYKELSHYLVSILYILSALMYLSAIYVFMKDINNNPKSINIKRLLFLIIIVFWGPFFVVLVYGFNLNEFKFMQWWGWEKTKNT